MSAAPPFDRFLEMVRMHLPHLDPAQPLDMDVPLLSLGLDSMEQVSLLIDLESAFDILVPDEFLVQQTFASTRSLWAVMGRLVPAMSGIPDI